MAKAQFEVLQATHHLGPSASASASAAARAVPRPQSAPPPQPTSASPSSLTYSSVTTTVERVAQRADEELSSSSESAEDVSITGHFDHLTAGVSSLTHALRFAPDVDLASALPAFPSAAPIAPLAASAAAAKPPASSRARNSSGNKPTGKDSKGKSTAARVGAAPVQGKLRKLKAAYSSVAKLITE
jgi:hypothetical protein